MYRYSKLAFIIQTIIFLFFMTGIIIFEYYINPDNLLTVCTGLTFITIAGFPYCIGVLNRKIVIDDSLHFFSFFSSLYTNKKDRDFDLAFVNISRIDYKKTIIPNKITIKLTIKNRSKTVFIEPFMENHKVLFKTICDRVKSENPDAYISPVVLNYISL